MYVISFCNTFMNHELLGIIFTLVHCTNVLKSCSLVLHLVLKGMLFQRLSPLQLVDLIHTVIIYCETNVLSSWIISTRFQIKNIISEILVSLVLGSSEKHTKAKFRRQPQIQGRLDTGSSILSQSTREFLIQTQFSRVRHVAL